MTVREGGAGTKELEETAGEKRREGGSSFCLSLSPKVHSSKEKSLKGKKVRRFQ